MPFLFLIQHLLFFATFIPNLEAPPEKVHYALFKEDPIDVIIPCSPKDIDTLVDCIRGVKENVANVRRVIVISSAQLTKEAEWFPESAYPFSKLSMMTHFFGDEEEARRYLSIPGNRGGWMYQQLLKIYAYLVIPGLSSNLLIVDADTIFLNPTEFISSEGGSLFNPGFEYCPAYFSHMQRLIPWLNRVYPEYSGISHHMLFQKEVLLDFIHTIEAIHHVPAWEAICNCLSPTELFASGFSEYEMYFNFALMRTDQVKIRKLQWINSPHLRLAPLFKKEGYNYASFHAYCREN